jgi:hypothetical protein
MFSPIIGAAFFGGHRRAYISQSDERTFFNRLSFAHTSEVVLAFVARVAPTGAATLQSPTSQQGDAFPYCKNFFARFTEPSHFARSEFWICQGVTIVFRTVRKALLDR